MPEQRDRWSTRTAFIMAAVGSAVGLGNVWRFPYVAYMHGGGAFFIPYFVALLTAGIPLMILEFGLGQKMQASAPAALGRANKHTEWVGWFALLVGAVISCYYAVIMAYAVEYLYYSVCGFFKGGAMPWSDPSVLSAAEAAKGKAEEEVFFVKRVLDHSLKAGQMWTPVWHLALALVAVWSAVFWIICKGVKRVGRVVMWTVPLPVVLLVILAIRGLTLPGAGDGIVYYLTPDFSKLGDPGTWLAAYGQVFFSLTIGFGVMIAYASYRPTDTDVTNNAFITSFANCATSFLAGFAVFSVLGFLAYKGGVAVPDVVKGGGGLAFVTYPTAISKMAEFGSFWPPLIGVLFFVMLLTLGIDSLFSLVEGVVAGFHDRYPSVTRGRVAAAMCGFCLLMGVFIFSNRAGDSWIGTFDNWANNYGLAIVGLLQCLIIGYLYRTDDLRDYVNRVSEIKLWGWWELCIRLLAPGALIYLLASQLVKELGRGEFFGATGEAYDAYLWIAPAVFALLFVAAFALSKKWTNLKLVGGGVAAFLLALGLLAVLSSRRDFDLSIRVTHDEKDPRKVVLAAESGDAPQDAKYYWRLPDGTTAEGRSITHDFKRDGEHTVTLVAIGEQRRTSTVAKISARRPGAPVVKVHAERPAGEAPLLVRFAAEVLKPGPEGTEEPLENLTGYSFAWDFGDGAAAEGVRVSHVFALRKNSYPVVLTARDPDGAELEVAKPPAVSVRKPLRRSASAALLCALGATILFGGLAVCLGIARRGRAPGDEPEFDTEAATRIAPALTEKDYEEYVAGKGGGGAEPSPEDDLA